MRAGKTSIVGVVACVAVALTGCGDDDAADDAAASTAVAAAPTAAPASTSSVVAPSTSQVPDSTAPSAPSSSAGDVVEAGDRLIELQAGMTWVYDATAELTPPGAPSAVPLSGTITITIEDATFEGEAVRALKFAQALAPPPDFVPPGSLPGPPPGTGDGPSIFGGEAPPVGIFYFRQDPDTGDVVFVGDNNGEGGAERAALGEGGLFIPGQWSTDTAYENNIDWAGGGYTHNFLSVSGLEAVETPAGTFESWVSPNGSDGSDGLVTVGTDWWAPELGQPSKFETTTTLGDGTTIRLEAVLRSTTVTP